MRASRPFSFQLADGDQPADVAGRAIEVASDASHVLRRASTLSTHRAHGSDQRGRQPAEPSACRHLRVAAASRRHSGGP